MRKEILTAAAFLALTIGSAAGDPISREADTVDRSIGAPVYDLSGWHVGRIAGYAVQAGTPSAIVAMNSPSKDVAIALENLEPRQEGGWLATLDTRSVMALHPWHPGSAWDPG